MRATPEIPDAQICISVTRSSNDNLRDEKKQGVQSQLEKSTYPTPTNTGFLCISSLIHSSNPLLATQVQTARQPSTARRPMSQTRHAMSRSTGGIQAGAHVARTLPPRAPGVRLALRLAAGLGTPQQRRRSSAARVPPARRANQALPPGAGWLFSAVARLLWKCLLEHPSLAVFVFGAASLWFLAFCFLLVSLALFGFCVE